MRNNGYTYGDRINPNAEGLSLLTYYVERYPHSTREEWEIRIREGIVLRNGVPSSPQAALVVGDQLTYRRPPWDEPAAPVSFAVLYEDDDVVAVAKPSGLPVLPGGEHLVNTLLSSVRRRYPDSPDPVHRLGRGTSGIVLFARTSRARRSLSEDLYQRRITKIYRALVTGVDLPATFSITTPIGRVAYPDIGYLYAASDTGKASRSDVRVLHPDTDAGRTLVEVNILTGRPHQIRIHLASTGHPLVGDPLYSSGGVPVATPEGSRLPLPGDTGYHLHAHIIEFRHPLSGRPIRIECHPPPLLRRPAKD